MDAYRLNPFILRFNDPRIGPAGQSSAYEIPEEVMAIDQLLNEIKERFEKKEKVYIRVNKGKHKGAIGFIKKIKSFEAEIKRNPGRANEWYTWKHHLEVTLGFDDRKNVTSTVACGYRSDEYLRNYKGKTVWVLDKLEDKCKKAGEEPIYDMRGNELKVGDIVVFINARYGNGSSLDYGKIDDIKTTVKQTYNGSAFKRHVVVRSLRRSKNGNPEQSKINHPENYILCVTGTDIEDDAVLAKLQT